MQDGSPDIVTMRNEAYRVDPELGANFDAALVKQLSIQGSDLQNQKASLNLATDKENAQRSTQARDVAASLSQQMAPSPELANEEPSYMQVRRTILPYADTEIGDAILKNAGSSTGGFGKTSSGLDMALHTPESIKEATKLLDAMEQEGGSAAIFAKVKRPYVNLNAPKVMRDIGDWYGVVTKENAKLDATGPTRVKLAGQIAAVSGDAGTRAKLAAERDIGKSLSETSAERLGDFGASLAQVETMSSSFKNPDSPQGPISQIRRLNPYDWQAKAKEQLVAATKQLVGKALEGGVLRAEDEIKYNKILPTIGDTYQTAVQKTINLQTMLDNAYKAKRSALKSAGYYVDKFPGSYLRRGPARLTTKSGSTYTIEVE
jgi:hypothetical protein